MELSFLHKFLRTKGNRWGRSCSSQHRPPRDSASPGGKGDRATEKNNGVHPCDLSLIKCQDYPKILTFEELKVMTGQFQERYWAGRYSTLDIKPKISARDNFNAKGANFGFVEMIEPGPEPSCETMKGTAGYWL
ncbi:hypothetical protein CUMW_136780 [Citrus unshiu]|uniref:Uncharacterized protein n=1 Tax=Citrus unshiu TaxID=55188 RepID=A0A2H5PHC8_CITUN|nr:hypothetical protein CUMW_136780 [Citrus unshiu]